MGASGVLRERREHIQGGEEQEVQRLLPGQRDGKEAAEDPLLSPSDQAV